LQKCQLFIYFVVLDFSRILKTKECGVASLEADKIIIF